MIDAAATTGEEPDFEWMIVEIFGHRRHAGKVREEERFGAKMLRIDIPAVSRELADEAGASKLTVDGWKTHFYGGSAIFSATLTDEATAMRINAPYEHPARYALPPVEDNDEDGFPI